MELTQEVKTAIVDELREKLRAMYDGFSDFKKSYVSASLWCEVKGIAPWQLREDVLFNGMVIKDPEFKAGVLKFCNDQIEARNAIH